MDVFGALALLVVIAVIAIGLVVVVLRRALGHRWVVIHRGPQEWPYLPYMGSVRRIEISARSDEHRMTAEALNHAHAQLRSFLVRQGWLHRRITADEGSGYLSIKHHMEHDYLFVRADDMVDHDSSYSRAGSSVTLGYWWQLGAIQIQMIVDKDGKARLESPDASGRFPATPSGWNAITDQLGRKGK